MKKLRCNCPKCGEEFDRPAFNRTDYQKEYMKNQRKKSKENVAK
jgi:hypothetical protein